MEQSNGTHFNLDIVHFAAYAIIGVAGLGYDKRDRESKRHFKRAR
jgi:hypothetical protein